MQKHNAWLYYAEADLIAAKKLLDDEDSILIGPSVYHAQQCAEKALKAYLLYQHQPIKKTHDLVLLINQAKAFDNDFTFMLDNAIELNPFATETRYPDDNFQFPDLDQAKKAFERAQQILNFVQAKIK